MHSNVRNMLSKNGVTMPQAEVHFAFITPKTYQFTYLLTNSIHYEKESIFFDDDALASRFWFCESRGDYRP